MTTIASMIGITWDGVPAGPYRLLPHAAKMASTKGFTRSQVLDAANNPAHTYDNGRYEGQKRHVKGNIVAVVNPAERTVVTVYVNVDQTAVRHDQPMADKDAFLKFASTLAKPVAPV